MMWHVFGVVCALSIMGLIALLAWETRAPVENVVEDMAWERHCADALAVARIEYSDEALALADLAIWQMDLCYCGECRALYAEFGCAP